MCNNGSIFNSLFMGLILAVLFVICCIISYNLLFLGNKLLLLKLLLQMRTKGKISHVKLYGNSP